MSEETLKSLVGRAVADLHDLHHKLKNKPNTADELETLKRIHGELMSAHVRIDTNSEWTPMDGWESGFSDAGIYNGIIEAWMSNCLSGKYKDGKEAWQAMPSPPANPFKRKT